MSFMKRIRESASLRLLLIGFLSLALLIPISMTRSLIGERISYRNQAIREVSSLWGRSQSLIGPIMSMPYRVHRKDKKGRPYTEIRRAYFLPEFLDIKADLKVQKRKRGIFEIPLYKLQWHISGSFKRPNIAALKISTHDVLWQDAAIFISIPDTRGIREGRLAMKWNRKSIEFQPGSGAVGGPRSGIHIRIGDPRRSNLYRFSTKLELQGSEELKFAPLGKKTTASLSSNWPDPSFNGAFLPVERKVRNDGFDARWQVSHLGANLPRQSTDSSGDIINLMSPSSFGVRLLIPTDFYRKSERAVKYAILFIVLTFLAFFLFEVFYKLRFHPVQYFLIGGALILFYVLFLALAEHIGFYPAYFLSAVGIVGIISGYGSSLLGEKRRVFVLLGILTGLYSYLLVTLQSQDYALLFGAIALTLILAGVMFITRKVDWHQIKLDTQGSDSERDEGE